MLRQHELHIRAAFFSSIRSFFKERKFLEVDTPIRQPVIIPESNIVPISAEGSFLQTSPELCMKRLLASGCEKIFQICPCFRKEELGRHHLEEFTMLEWYRSDATYIELMEDCENLLVFILEQLVDEFQDNTVFSAKSLVLRLEAMKAGLPWERLSVKDAFDRYSPLPLHQVLQNDTFDETLVEHVEPQLGTKTPVFLYDYPAQMASLARKKQDNESLAERFELYIQGIELANGFSELTESSEQRCRFEEEIAQIESETRTTGGMPEKLLTDLDKLGEAAGIALGVDRLMMIFLGKSSLAETVSISPSDF